MTEPLNRYLSTQSIFPTRVDVIKTRNQSEKTLASLVKRIDEEAENRKIRSKVRMQASQTKLDLRTNREKAQTNPSGNRPHWEIQGVSPGSTRHYATSTAWGDAGNKSPKLQGSKQASKSGWPLMDPTMFKESKQYLQNKLEALSNQPQKVSSKLRLVALRKSHENLRRLRITPETVSLGTTQRGVPTQKVGEQTRASTQLDFFFRDAQTSQPTLLEEASHNTVASQTAFSKFFRPKIYGGDSLGLA